MPISLFIKFIDERLDGNLKDFGIAWLKDHGITYHQDDEYPRIPGSGGGSLHQIPENDTLRTDQAWRGGLSNK